MTEEEKTRLSSLKERSEAGSLDFNEKEELRHLTTLEKQEEAGTLNRDEETAAAESTETEQNEVSDDSDGEPGAGNENAEG